MNRVVVEFGPRPSGRASRGELPTVRFADRLPPRDTQVAVDLEAWQSGAVDLYAVDAAADGLGEAGLVPVAAAGEPAARRQLVTRCQRWLDRRNAASASAAFDAVLAVHRRLHDRRLPLVRADHNHALDTWQWVLRLDSFAGAAPQIAALFHDVERLESEASRRVEHLAASYQDFKRRHAETGAGLMRRLLGDIPALASSIERAAALVAAGDRAEAAARDPALAVLEDADALSFFSLNSGGFLDYYGPRHTAFKVAWTLRRLSPRAAAALPRLHLRPDVAGILAGVLTTRGGEMHP